MSIQIIAKVLEASLPPLATLTLLAFADNADDSGFCYPSLRTIQIKTSIKKTTLIYHIKTLDRLQLLNRTKRYAPGTKRHTSTAYIINIQELDKYILKHKNLSKLELKKLELKISDIAKKYQKYYRNARKQKSISRSPVEQLKSEGEQPKNIEKTSKIIANVNNLNHQSMKTEEDVEIHFNSFYKYLNSIGVRSTKNEIMHKRKIKQNLLFGDFTTKENFDDYLKSTFKKVLPDSQRKLSGKNDVPFIFKSELPHADAFTLFNCPRIKISRNKKEIR